MQTFSRRQLLKNTTISAALFSLPMSLWAAVRDKLIVPPLIEVRRGRPIVRKLIMN